MDTVEGVLQRLNQLLADVERTVRTDAREAGQSDRSGQPYRARSPEAADAIDRAIDSRRRTTSVRGLRGAEVFERFKQELIDGLIRVDAGHRLLDLVEAILVYAGVRR